MLRAGDTAAWLGAGHGGRAAHEGGEAGAGEAAQGVDTHRVGPAHSGLAATLVNIQAESSCRLESCPADTLPAVTLGVVGAVEVGFAESSHLGRLTGNIAVTGES